MFELGNICSQELRDTAAALEWYIPAAELGHYGAQEACANIYSVNTKQTKANYRLAIKYYQLLIEQEQQKKNRAYKYRINDYQNKIEKLKLKIED